MRAERALRADIRVHPGVGERREVGAGRVLVEAITADPRPRREVVLLAVLRGRRRDVMHRREFTPDPRSRVVLIRDRVDAELRDQAIEVGGRSRRARVLERLRQCVGAAPAEHPQRPRIGPIRGAQDQLGSGRHVLRADRRHAVARLPRDNHRAQRAGRRKPGAMRQERRAHLLVRIHERPEHVGTHLPPHPRGRRRDEALDVELVRVHEEPHHRHLVVRLVRDVGHHDDALRRDVRIDARRQCIRRGRCLEEHQTDDRKYGCDAAAHAGHTIPLGVRARIAAPVTDRRRSGGQEKTRRRIRRTGVILDLKTTTCSLPPVLLQSPDLLVSCDP
jgi:hypothetical protein